jgi:outer membrane protein TolC
MKKIILIMLIIILPACPDLSVGFAYSQDKLTLEDCYKLAVEKYPLSKQKKLLVSINKLEQDNTSKNWLPKLDLNAQATYQSEVTKVNVTMPEIQIPGGNTLQIPELDIPVPSKDQYKLTLDFSQMIYDGGITSANKKFTDVSNQANIQSVEVNLYKLKERINQVYFASLLLQENLNQINLMKQNITERIKVMESAVKNGVALQSNLDYLNAEMLKLEQKEIELETGRKTALASLSSLIMAPLDDETELEIPDVAINSEQQISRPELKLFELQEKSIGASSDIVDSKRMPKIFGFGQFGYGRPALNMLSNDFNTFYFVGLKFTWNIWDWGLKKNNLESIILKEEIVKSNREVFDRNLKIVLDKELNEIKKYEDMILKDDEIINLKTKITKTSASKLDNGVINSSDYISDLNEEIQAKINRQSHKIQLIQAKINYKTLSGN